MAALPAAFGGRTSYRFCEIERLNLRPPRGQMVDQHLHHEIVGVAWAPQTPHSRNVKRAELDLTGEGVCITPDRKSEVLIKA